MPRSARVVPASSGNQDPDFTSSNDAGEIQSEHPCDTITIRRLSQSVPRLTQSPSPTSPLETSDNTTNTARTGEGDNIRVYIRIRPCSPGICREVRSVNACVVEVSDQTKEGALKRFTYDGVLGEEATQSDSYEMIGATAAHKVCNGINATVFAYGQTGSGKTHTMLGDASTAEDLGVIPRVLTDIFQYVEKQQGTRNCTVEVSVLEIYNEHLRDLAGTGSKHASDTGTAPRVAIREGHDGRIKVCNLSRAHVESVSETLSLLGAAIDARAVAATNANASSSRSHLIFSVELAQVVIGDVSSAMTATLHLVDLAGSERQSKTGAKGVRLKEGANINKSLTTLGKVIAALAAKEKYVPFRDSKLTRLLQPSLGGNAYTVILACVSASGEHTESSLSTLRFADRAKHIVNSPTVNVDPATQQLREAKALIAAKDAEIASLRAQMVDLEAEITTLKKPMQVKKHHWCSVQ